MSGLKPLWATLVLLSAAPGYSSAQELEGREARVWSHGSAQPSQGILANVSPTAIRLETEHVQCGPSGCVNELSLEWSSIDRLQISALTGRQRAVRAGIMVGAIGILMGPVQNSLCSSGSGKELHACTMRINLGAGAIAALGFIWTRERWKDVTDRPDGADR